MQETKLPIFDLFHTQAKLRVGRCTLGTFEYGSYTLETAVEKLIRFGIDANSHPTDKYFVVQFQEVRSSVDCEISPSSHEPIICSI